MRPLYEIDADIERAAEEFIDPDTGEITNPEVFDALEMERTAKLEGVSLAIKNKLAELEMVEKERARLQARERSLECAVEGMKAWLGHALAGEKFRTGKVSVTFRRTYTTRITDENLIPDEFRKVREEISYDKAALRARLMDGATIPGATLEERRAVQIK